MPKITDQSNQNFVRADLGLALHDNEKIIHAGPGTSETKKTISDPVESPFPRIKITESSGICKWHLLKINSFWWNGMKKTVVKSVVVLTKADRGKKEEKQLSVH